MTNRHEDTTRRTLREFFALELRKIPETTEPTPDFNVYSGGHHIAVLEVKALEATAPVMTPKEILAIGPSPGELRRDNCAGRVATKVHEAVHQLRGSSLPKILVLVNDSGECDEFDLQEVLRGFLPNRSGQSISTLPAAARNRARQDRSSIDLFIWLEGSSCEAPQLVSGSAAGKSLRTQYLGSPPADDAD